MYRKMKQHFWLSFILGGIVLILGSQMVVHSWKGAIKSRYYKVFAIDQTISWAQNNEGFFRMDARKNLDNMLLTQDQWKKYDLTFKLINLRTCALILHFLDKQNFYFVSFEPTKNLLVWCKKTRGEFEVLKPVAIVLPHDENLCRVIVDKGRMRFFLNGRKIFDDKMDRGSGFFGFLLDSAAAPVAGFADISVKGILSSGLAIDAQAPLKGGFSLNARVLGAFVFMLIVTVLWGAFVVWAGAQSLRLFLFMARSCDERLWLKRMGIILVHAVVSVVVFWPFFRRGDVLIASYDNIGEILPLFFYSKHVFLNWWHGACNGLWNPLAHDGVPFYTSHWNMAFYPLHWPIFFAPDHQVLFWLTLKSFFETLMMGLLAYGFFYRELGSRIWALICSVSYQLGSLLIFTLTLFPTISLFFSMTLYLYLVWSLKERPRVLNYFWITLATYFILTSANVAFVFYGGLSLLVLTAYRLFSTSSENKREFWTVIGGGITGFLIASIRVLPCLWGVMSSNRLVSDYFSIHDRFPFILRLFVPSIAGWLGPNAFAVLRSPHLGWVFNNINPQSGFFVYYGVVMAWLILLPFAVRGGNTLRFWKVYAWTLLLMALLWKPVWGVLSILFFPLNHYSYHTIMLPAAVCGLGGHVGMAFMRGRIDQDRLFKVFVTVLMGFVSYVVVFLTYLSPLITPYSRIFLLGVIAIGVTWWWVSRYRPQSFSILGDTLVFAWFVLSWSVLFVMGVLVVLTDIPMKFGMDEQIFWPYLLGLNFLGLCVYWRTKFFQAAKIRSGVMWLAGWMIAVIIGFTVMARAVDPLLQTNDGLRVYILDVMNGSMKWLVMTFLLAGGYIIFKKNKGSPKWWGAAVLILVVADLLTFNMRFDNITAPFSFQRAFYPKSFFYENLKKKVRQKLDLKNYRVGHQERAALNANKNFIFDVPSYSGTIGYMPKRFAEFIHAFGVPEDTILIYPSDAIDDKRFLDLSCVKYIFKNEEEFKVRESALPRMAVFYDYSVILDSRLLLKALTDERFDYQTEVLLAGHLRKDPVRPLPIPHEPVDISFSNSDQVRAHVQVKYPGLILFNESYDEGWQAYIDGHKVKVVPANHNFMACPVPAGGHDVKFIYRPLKYMAAKIIHDFGVVIFLVVCGFGLFVKYAAKPKRRG